MKRLISGILALGSAAIVGCGGAAPVVQTAEMGGESAGAGKSDSGWLGIDTAAPSSSREGSSGPTWPPMRPSSSTWSTPS
jgi:hypothetical protein